ncbi:DUF4168 domain-containing protein [Sphingomonas sp. 37zxx]|uniref:DUF4168 domain-containing protein n=1 Tax=Sphingomonas sp. 37zxx TaxID=1550073 RepID=UPI00068A75B9|nr:DUF4168 domain-containing protein [Sphingomonas sp. 37zxx]
MNIRHFTIVAAGLLTVNSPAFAQAMASGQAAPEAQAQTAPATSTGPISDADVTRFAKAVVAVEAVQKDTAIAPAEKQAQMAAKVQATGLEPAKFNQIAQTMQSDPALQAKVSAAVLAESSGAAPAR